MAWLLPTMGGLLVVLSYAFTLFLRGNSLFAGDGDPGRHIRLGDFILETGSIPRVDVFSHTMRGTEFIPFEWLSEVFFAIANAANGLTGVAVLTAALFSASVGLVYLAMRLGGVPAPLAFGFGVLSLVLQSVHLHPRPHMFTTLLVALFSLVLLQVRRGASPRWLLVLPAAMVPWVNLHGGFLVGFILIAAFAADAVVRWLQEERRIESRGLAVWFTATLAACLLVSLLNPAGWELWPHTTGYLRETYLVDFTQEYKSPDFHDTLLKSFLLTLLLGTVVLAVLRPPVDRLGLALWVLFAAFALHSTRNVPLFGVVCIPWLAGWTVSLLTQDGSKGGVGDRVWRWSLRMQQVQDRLHGWLFPAVALLILTVAAVQRPESDRFAFAPDVFPVRAVEVLQERGFAPPGPIYNEFIWGGYLLYAWREVPVFIDGQTDFYGEQLTREYRDIRFIQPGWQDLLTKHEVEWIMVPPDSPLSAALQLTEHWSLVYSDSTAAVWEKGGT